jgi:hypothetical protein
MHDAAAAAAKVPSRKYTPAGGSSTGKDYWDGNTAAFKHMAVTDRQQCCLNVDKYLFATLRQAQH